MYTDWDVKYHVDPPPNYSIQFQTEFISKERSVRPHLIYNVTKKTLGAVMEVLLLLTSSNQSQLLNTYDLSSTEILT